MSELFGHGMPLVESVGVEDSVTTQLLLNPEVQQGLARVDEKIDDYAQQLKSSEEMPVERIFDGATPDGLGISIVKAGPIDKADFSIFTYSLDAIADPELTDNLEPRETTVAARNISSTRIVFAKPGEKFTLSVDDLCRAKELKDQDPKAFSKLTDEISRQIYAHDRQTLVVTKGKITTVTLDGVSVKNFEWHTFGDRRRAVIEQAIKPIEEARKRLATTGRFHEQRDALLHRSQSMRNAMSQNPETVARATDEFVFDPVKAEYMADAMNKVRAGRRGKAAVKAAAEYDEDPAGIRPPRKGLFRRS